MAMNQGMLDLFASPSYIDLGGGLQTKESGSINLVDPRTRDVVDANINTSNPHASILSRFASFFQKGGSALANIVNDPGFGGALGHIAAAVSPVGSWQHNLGAQAALAGKASAVKAYTDNLTATITGQPTKPLSKLQELLVDPEMRAQGIQAVLSAEKLKQDTADTAAKLRISQQNADQLGAYYESQEEYQKWLQNKPEKEQKNFVVKTVGVGDNQEQDAVIDLTTNKVTSYIGKPTDKFNPNTGQGNPNADARSQGRLDLATINSIRSDVNQQMIDAGYGTMVIDAAGNRTLNWKNPAEAEKRRAELMAKMVRDYVKIGALDPKFATIYTTSTSALKIGDPIPGIPGVTVQAVLPDGYFRGSDGKKYKEQ